MKISILIPSLDRDYLAELLPQIRLPDTEIVVCSPYDPQGLGVVWAPDVKLAGNCPAMRQAFQASSGEGIVCMCDDITMEPGWLAEGLSLLGVGERVVSLRPAESCACFGRLYANLPLVRRGLVAKHWDRFFPYHSHWGDVAFSLAVWSGGGQVIATARELVKFRDRSGHPEPEHKGRMFTSDCRAFLNDFPREASQWLVENWRLFNHPA